MLVTTGTVLPRNTAPSAHQAANTKTPRERRGKSCRGPRKTVRVSARSARGITDAPERGRRATGSMRSNKNGRSKRRATRDCAERVLPRPQKYADREIRVKDWEGCIDVARRRTDKFSVSRDGPVPSQIFICAERVLLCPQSLRRARNHYNMLRGINRRRLPRRPAPKLSSTRQAVDSDRPRTSGPRRLSQCRFPASASHDTRPEPAGT